MKTWILVLPLLFPAVAWAELGFDLSPSKSSNRVSLMEQMSPAKPVAGGNGQYGERDFAVRASFLAYQDLSSEGAPTMVSISPQMDRRDLLGLGPLRRDAVIYSTGLSVNLFHRSESKETYFAGTGVSLSGELGQPGASRWVPSLYGVGTYHFNSSTALLYGAAFSSAFGIFIPIPVLGLSSQLSTSWSLMTILPVLTQVTYRASEQWSWMGLLRGTGYESRIANEGHFQGKDSGISVRSRAFELGLGTSYEFTKSISFQTEVGALFARKLTFSDSSGSIFTQKVNFSPVFVQLAATFAIPRF